MLNQRRYDIDALRSIGMFLLIFYHLAISFTSISQYVLFIPNKRTTDSIWNLLNLLNSWRMPLIFLIAGIALRLSFQKRSQSEMLRERFKILGIPWIFGTAIFGTAHIVIVATYYEGWSTDSLWSIIFAFQAWGFHLWFLINILIYSWVLIPVLNYISYKDWKENFISKLIQKPGGIFIFSIPIIFEGQILNDLRFMPSSNYGDIYRKYALSGHGFVLGFLRFFLGIILVSQGDAFWDSNKKNWKIHLFIGLSLYFYRFINDFKEGFAADNRLIAFESFNFIFLMLGLGAVYLNKDSPQLTYYKTAVYPVYIVHLPVQMGLMYYFADINMHPIIKFPLVLFLICFVSLTIYHSIKNIKLLRPLFGLRNA